jgi:hypothetical protein
MERETGFEPATSTLARSHSTAELLPLVFSFYSTCKFRPNHSLFQCGMSLKQGLVSTVRTRPRYPN